MISRYHRVHGDDRLAVGLIPYLCAVDTLAEIPASITRAEGRELRNRYWEQHLQQIAPSGDGKPPKGDWIQLAGSAHDRTTFTFQAETTIEQDDRLIDYFNHRQNRSRFNLFLHNCADFSRVVLNLYFPGAVHRNRFADFGFTTPKQVARCMVEGGGKHPQSRVQMMRIGQVPGEIARSHRLRVVSESLLKSKRYLFPLLVAAPAVEVVSGVA